MHVGTGSGNESLRIQFQLRLRLGLRGVNVNAPVRHARAHTRTSLARTGLLVQVPLGHFRLPFARAVCVCLGVCVFL